MRKIVVTEFLSVDGVMENPDQWSAQFWRDEAGQFKVDELLASDAILLGRLTYQAFAGYWPTATDETGFAERMNSVPKYVVPKTLNTLEWNNSHLIKSNVAQEVVRLKQQPGRDILLEGSAELAQMLMQHDLVDEYRLMIHPVIVGSGKRLFRDGNTTTLQLVDTKPLSLGIVILTYQPAAKSAG